MKSTSLINRMIFTSWCLLFVLLPAAKAQDKPMSLKFDFVDTLLRDALVWLIEQGVSVVFQEEHVNGIKTTARCDSCTANEALSLILQNTPLRAENRDCFVIQRQLGSLQGRVIDEASQEPLPGANVFLKSTQYGCVTGVDGTFKISKIPFGKHVLIVSLIGYRSDSRDVTVGLTKADTIAVPLPATTVEGEEVVIEIEKTKNEGPGIHHVTSAEIKHDPFVDSPQGIKPPTAININGGGVSNFSFRGGSSFENHVVVNGVSFNNYHIASLGSGGAYLAFDPDLIEGITYHIAHSPLQYGNNITTTEIEIRKGASDRLRGQLNFASDRVGGIFEGPIFKNKGTFLLSLRGIKPNTKSDLTFLSPVDKVQLIDLMGKLDFNLSKNHEFSIFNSIMSDKIEFPNLKARYKPSDFDTRCEGDTCKEAEFEQGSKISSNVFGLNWQWRWGNNRGFSTTTLSYSNFIKRGNLLADLGTEADPIGISQDFDLLPEFLSQFDYQFDRQIINIRNMNTYLLKGRNLLEVGIDLNGIVSKKQDFGPEKTVTGTYGEGLTTMHTKSFGVFGGFTFDLKDRFDVSFGIRGDYYPNYTMRYSSYIYGGISDNPAKLKNVYISSSFSIDYKASSKTLLALSTNTSHQNLALSAFSPDFHLDRSLASVYPNWKFPSIRQCNLKLAHSLGKEVHFDCELYYKYYTDLPRHEKDYSYERGVIWTFNALDWGNSFWAPFFENNQVSYDGKAFARGLELTLKKNPSNGFYGSLSASFSSAKYQDSYGHWRPRATDHRCQLNLQTNYQFNQRLNIGIAWLYSGGNPLL